MIDIYSGVSFSILLKHYTNDEIKQLKKDLSKILNTWMYCDINQSSFRSSFKDYEEDDFVVIFSTPNGCCDFQKETLEEAKSIFKNEVIVEISSGFNGIKSIEDWKNPFTEGETLRLKNIGYTEKELCLNNIQEFIKRHTIENLEKGYVICESFESSDDSLIYGTTILGQFVKNPKFKNNIEARLAAAKDGIKFINDIPHLPKNTYIDTEKNRKLIESELKEDSMYWTIEVILNRKDKEQQNCPKEETYRYLYEKEYGKVDHLVWLYLDKNNYDEKEQKYFEEIFEDYRDVYENIFSSNIDILIENLDKNKLEYDLIIAILNNP